MAVLVEFDGRYRFPFRVFDVRDDRGRMLYSRHKTRAAADAAADKLRKALAYFEANKVKLTDNP